MSDLNLNYRHWIFISVWKIILIVALLVSGCSSPAPTTGAVLSTQSPSPTMPVQTKTPTITATGTATIRPTSTASLTPTSSWTPTLPPTLSAIEREAYVKELLHTNADCDLPCWWGIEPGKTTWRETEEYLRYLGAVTSVFPRESGPIFHETGGFDFNEEYLYNRVSFFESNEIVISIEVHGYGLTGLTNPSVFIEVWEQFSPKIIVPKYGLLSRVWIQSIKSVSEGKPGPTMPYNLWIFYDDLGILIRYQGQVVYQETYIMCPTFQEDGNLEPVIDLYLKSPESIIPLESLSDYMHIPKSHIFSLEEATDLTLEEFTALYNKQEKTPCFETPREIWP